MATVIPPGVVEVPDGRITLPQHITARPAERTEKAGHGILRRRRSREEGVHDG
jgi:hypothetical protein